MAEIYLLTLLFLLYYQLLILKALMSNILVQYQQAQKIWNCHQTIHSIREVPYKIQSLSCTYKGNQAEQNTIAHQHGTLAN